MPRPKRFRDPNHTYHICSRCIENRDLMEDDLFKDIMVEVLRNAGEKYIFDLIAYEILHNHFHFIIYTVEGGADISRIIQYIKSRFAEKYNKITKRTGAFWSERFRSKVIEDAVNPVLYLLWLLWYLAFNPVRKKMVKDPRKSRYGSINSYLDEKYKSPVKIKLHRYFIDLGNTFHDRVEKFLYYEEAYRKRLSIIY
jgi:putative transposase